MPELSLAALKRYFQPVIDAASTPPQATGADYPERGLAALGGGLAHAATEAVATPGRLMAPNPWKPGTEQWDFYEQSKQQAAMNWAPDMALNMIGSPALGGVSAGGREAVLGSGAVRRRDPALWNDVSGIKLARPLSEVPQERLILDPQMSKERLITPEDLYKDRSALVPVFGDRTAAGYAVTKVGDTPLPQAVDLYGGHGFMSQDPSHIWASKQGVIKGLANNVRGIAEKTGRPVELAYSAMGPQAVDFSTFASDALALQMKNAPVAKAHAAEFDKRMIEGNKSFDPVPDFPGVKSDNLMQWLRDQPGRVRDRFAKLMDNSEFRAQGFPNVGETRHAIIDPRLLNAGLGDAGMSLARVDPKGIIGPSKHPTYSTGLEGSYTGGLGTSVPFNVMFPDMAAYYAQRYPTTRFDKLATSLAGDVKHQEANQQWLDGIMRHLEQRQR